MNLTSQPTVPPMANDRRTLLEDRLHEATNGPEVVPLSFAQQRLWLLDQLEPNSPLYNVPLALELTGELDTVALQQALDELVNRHEILRTRFICDDESPVQVIDQSGSLTVSFYDLSATGVPGENLPNGISHSKHPNRPEARSAEFPLGQFQPLPQRAEREPGAPVHREETEARRILQAEATCPFDLSAGRLMRAMLIRLDAERHWLLLTFHHIVSDEWSLKVCLRELAELYDGFHRNGIANLPELPIQYADFTLWQRDRLRGKFLDQQLAYWRTRLQGNPPALELHADNPRGVTPTFRGSIATRQLPARLADDVKAFAARNDATLFMVLLAAFKALLHRYTQQTDLLVGSPVAGRNQLETEHLIGFFVNTLILRTDLSGDPTFEELLRRVRKTTLDACAHQDLPFEKLVEALRPERTLNHNPFTRVMFAVQNQADEPRWPGLQIRVLETETGTAKFDLTLVMQETAAGLTARIEFNRDLFHAAPIARMLGHLENLLAGIASQPQRRLSELPLLTGEERRMILADWNATATDYPANYSISQLFQTQVERAPGAIAVSFGGETLTYAELDARANQLARHLEKFSVASGTPVGLCLERSPDLIVAMLAILKAGGAYVPLDPGYPKLRLAQMLADSQPPVLITQQKFLSALPRGNARMVCLDSDWELIKRESRENIPSGAHAESVAYIIYTSGSTGRPKGVAVPHRAIARLVLNTNYVQLTPADRIAQASNASFDAATFEIWGALLNGAKLVGISTDVALSPGDFARELRDQKVTVLFLTTALFNQIAAEQPDAFAPLRAVLFGGETVDPRWVRAVLRNPPRHLLHVYGPTENTTFSTWHEIREVPPNATTVPIGRPLANSQCYILDPHLNPVPIGIPGELHVSGDGLARGYWNQPELTAEKFVANPHLDGGSSKRLYQTGDLARWLPDGSIEFLGRLDNQVKLRGFRVEPGEIESTLAQHSGVRDCVVTVHTRGNGDRKLAAYFVPNGKRAPGVSELRQFLKARLPDYMIPSSFVRLNELPLTPNGKVDRKALPKPDPARPELEKRYATPRDAIELELTRIWENVLGVRPIGIEDKFFELGGHSLLAVRVIAQIEKSFSRKLKLATIFQAQTIEQLAAILRKDIQEDSAISGTSLVEIQPKGSRPPLFLVHGAGGGMFWGYVNLSRHLGQDQPVYGLRSRALDGREEFQTIEQMAAQYIDDLRAIQPRGPYHIGGYCFGGNVAYEMARQLRQHGEDISALALFNCAPANSRYSHLGWTPRWFLRFGINLGYWAKYFLNWTPPQRREFFRWKREMFKRRADRFLGHSKKSKATVDAGELVDLSSYSEEQRKLWESHIRALVNYHPQPFPGRVYLFRSPGHPLLCSFDHDYGWGDLAKGGVEIAVVPGVHERILEEPCVKALAEQLATVLERQPGTRKTPEPTANANLQDRSYAAHFAAQASRTPTATAICFNGAELDFSELNARANRLAHRLQALGAGPDTFVAICLERSLEMPVAMLATLKAGAAYVPLDSAYPIERLNFMLADCRPGVLVTRSSLATKLNTGNATVICLDHPEEQVKLAESPTDNPACESGPDHLAYVLYTSGSTGEPKGVQITHRALLNHNFAIADTFQLTDSDRVLQFNPFSFDLSVEEIFPSWLRGATVVMRTDEVLSSVTRFFDWIAREKLTVINLPTAYWHEIVEHLSTIKLPETLRLIVIGGEAASPEAWRRWKKVACSKVVLINAYGPTEATVTATVHVARPEDDSLPIGQPLANTQVIIVDEHLQRVGPGAEGELLIGGAGLASGYLNRPELTAEKFIANPFPEISSDRLYRTGDRARFRSDGAVEFLGRADEQVKIRGYRIELGEIENALRSHASVKEAVVCAREDVAGLRRIVAYVVRRDRATSVGELLEFLKSKLPAYMIPAAFVHLDAFPLTPAGKIDRHQLPPPGNERPDLEKKFVAPRTPIEEVIADIWREVLRLDRVGVHDNFFDLGGHSLLAMQVISRLRENLQIEVPLGDLFELPTVAELAGNLFETTGAQPVLPVAAVTNGKQLPLTEAQRRIWFLDQFDPQQSPYNIPTALRLRGALNLDALNASLTELARRHEALRAVFPAANGHPVQIICEPKEIQISVRNLRDVPEADRETRARHLAIQEGRRSYIVSSPMFQPALWCLGEEDYLLLLTTHELACDAHSVRLLVQELVSFYELFASGSAPEPAIPGGDYVKIASLAGSDPEREAAHLEFWKNQLHGAPALLELPADHPRPAHQSDAGASQPIQLANNLAAGVEALSREYNCPPFATLLTVFQVLLARYTGATDIVVGSKRSNRKPGFDHVVGKLENLIALRGDLAGDPTFAELLERNRNVIEASVENGDLPFGRILNELRPQRNASYSPIFQVMFNHAPDALQPRRAADVTFEPFRFHNQTSKLDLYLELNRTPEGLSGFIEYSTALFNPDRIERMGRHFETLLAAVIRNPAQRISTLPLMPETEARKVLVEWNATQQPYPKDTTLIDLFERQTARTPDALALIAGEEHISYSELNARANQVAHHLRSLGVGPNTMVGICIERSWRLIAGILGVLKAGGAYVPLDPAYPKERLAFILEDANAPVLLTQESLRHLLADVTAKIVCLDSNWTAISAGDPEDPIRTSQSTDLGYVIYTSGSTGKPKGVAIENRAAVALIHWAKDIFTPEEISGVLASTSICFDLSIFEMFVPLSWGGTVILAQNALALPTLPAADRVTLINTVPSAIRELLRVKGVPSNVRVVNLAGEPLATPIVNQIYAETNAQKVYDLYGPSETTTYSTFTLRQANQPATIGKPLANEQVYLFDANRQPVPIGIPGELYIGGDKLARGYLNRPELTAEKFVPNPFQPGTRLYRTGDLARWRADGNLEYLGRIDHQVKIRGFRIELGEIESAYRKHPEVREIVVIARENDGGPKRLVAYLVTKPETQVTMDALRRFGKEHLPEYMVPSAFVMLAELPLTPNGKVDRKALPDPNPEPRDDGATSVAPRTPIEKQLATIWCEVLRIQRAGVHANFFELGGDSLLAIQVISRVREAFTVELPLFGLFDTPTIEALANGLQSGKWKRNDVPEQPLRRIPRDGILPVSFVQERLWFLDQLEPGSHAYNVPIALQLKGRLNITALEQAFSETAKRHETLRTTFAYEDGRLAQKISAAQPWQIDVTDLSATQLDHEEQLSSWLKDRSRRPFDLAAGPLTRVHLARLSESEHALLVVMHHTISDGWSLTILFQELEAFYDAFAADKPAPTLPPLPFQYADFAAWKRQQMQGAALDREAQFWKAKLKGAPASIALPGDHSEPEKANRSAGRATLQFSRETADAINQLSHRHNSTAFVVLMAALAATLEKWTHQRDLVIGTVVAGRNRREMESVIGCFMNFLPIRTTISGEESSQELLAKAKSAVLEAQEHQDCPFEKIVEAVNPERRQNQNPLYNVALLLQNFPTQIFRSQFLEATSLPVDLEAALLDLRFEAEWTDTGLSLACEYKKDLFEAETIRELLASYQNILEALIHQPDRKVSELQITEPLETQARARDRKAEQTVAIAATFTAEPIAESLRYWSRELDLAADVAFAPFNQVFQELLDPASLLNKNNRGLNVVLIRIEDWFKTGATHSEARALMQIAEEFLSALRTSVARSRIPFLVFLCPASHEVANNPPRRSAVAAVETFLATEIEKVNGAHVVTTDELLKLYSVVDYYDASGDELGKVPYTPVFFTALGTMIVRKLHALERAPHKVIVLDCDNTLWSGVCGEDGVAGICLNAPRQALQEFMRAQQNTGRLLAICSKNNEEDVREVFAQRLDMPLRHEHFAAWRTNWLPKSENLKSLAKELNLGLDSFIFVDDNPVECAEVEANCPEVLTLQLPEDVAQIPAFLRHCWAFDQAKLTAEDRKRGEMYRDNQQREQLRAHAGGLAEFIASLELEIEIAPMSREQLPRVSQLTHRTNQFNCTTIRRTEAEIVQLATAAEILTVTVRDRFGDYGLVGVVICSAKGEMLDVETFLLSCRVLGRGVEHAILTHLGRMALEHKLTWVDVPYHRSAKNQPAWEFLEGIGAEFRQPLNGGFIYRFPAKVAAEIAFPPKKKMAGSNGVLAEDLERERLLSPPHEPERRTPARLVGHDLGADRAGARRSVLCDSSGDQSANLSWKNSAPRPLNGKAQTTAEISSPSPRGEGWVRGTDVQNPPDHSRRGAASPTIQENGHSEGHSSPKKQFSPNENGNHPLSHPPPRATLRRYRWIALEANHPEKIHALINAKAKTHIANQSNYAAPVTDFQRLICSIWEKLLRIDRVGLKDNFFELGGHSLLAVRLFAELEKLTQRKYPLVTIFQAPTVEQLVAVLNQNDSGRAPSPIVPVQPNGNRPPLFLAHGAGGDVLWGYANLAKHLPPDQPVYGIKSRGQIGLDEFDSIEDMARYYIDEIRAVQPRGPYYLGGYCLGGNVAYEMARQLRSRGEDVALVVLLDAFPSNAGYETVPWWKPSFYFHFARNFSYWLDDFGKQTIAERRRFIIRKARIAGRRFLRRFERNSGAVDVDLEDVIDPSYFPEHELKFWEIHLRAITRHVERPYDGAVTLIRTRGQPLFCSFADDFCWGRLVKNDLKIRRIPGSHENIFVEPNVKHLAEQLQATLAEAQATIATAETKQE